MSAGAGASGGAAGERYRLRVVAACAALVLAALAAPLVRGEVYIQDDLGISFLPTRFLYAQSLVRGHTFVWTPELFCGYFLHGEGHVGMFHPLHLLLYRFLPLQVAFNLELLLPYPFAILGTLVLLRRLGLRPDAALLGGCAFAFSSFNVLQMVHPNFVAILAHMPWLLWAIEETLRNPDPRARAWARLGMTLLTVSQLLLGNPQGTWLSSLVEGLYALWRRPAGQSASLLGLGAAKLLAVLGGAIQLLPTWEVVGGSIRAAPSFMEGYRFLNSLEPANVLQLLAPYLTPSRVIGTRFVQEFVLYDGAFAAAALAWLITRSTAGIRDQSSLARASLALVGLGFVLALGKYGYLGLVTAYVPFVKWFGAPCRYILLVHFGLAVLSAVAFADLARLAERRERVPWRALWPLAALAAASTLVAAVGLWLRSRSDLFPDSASQLAPTAHLIAGAALLCGASALSVAAARGHAAAAPALLAFAVIDLGVYGVTGLRTPVAPMPIEAFVDGAAAPPDALGRVQSDNNVLVMRGVRLAGGYAAFPPAERREPLSREALQDAGVRWVQTRTPWGTQPRLQPGLRFDGASVTKDVAGGASSWSLVADPQPRVRCDPPCEVTIPRDEPGRIELVSAGTAPRLLRLSESWHSGWRATVSGRSVAVEKLEGAFLGVRLDAGTHNVRLDFAPTSVRAGAVWSVLGLVVSLLWCAAALRVVPG